MISFVRQYRSALIYSLCLVLGLLYCLIELQNIPETLKPVEFSSMEVTLVSTNNNVDKYRVQRDGRFLTYQQVMTLLSNEDSHLILRLSAAIEQKHDAVFWECIPVTKSSFSSNAFEFVILPAPTLAERTVDRTQFADKFDAAIDKPIDIITFQNLGKDCTLVVPMPPRDDNEIRHMTHLSSFLKNGRPVQVSHLWKKVGTTFISTINNERDQSRKFWLSTSGLGVSWLHVRIDTVPKYYNWQEYKEGR